MKKIIRNLLVLPVLMLACFACEDDTFENDYVSPVTIGFQNLETNMVTLGKGVLTYTVSITATATNRGITGFDIYSVNSKTGDKGAIIPGTTESFDPAVGSYSMNYEFTGLTEDKCIKVVVTDFDGKTYERNLLVKVTPSVLFSDAAPIRTINIETADDYYGSYYATWLGGRVYLQSNGAQYAAEVDLSLGQVDIGGTIVSALVSPAKRAEFGLPTMSGLQDTKYALTTLTAAQYNAITAVDPTTIASLADPTEDKVQVASGKVYLFKTANGKKGLMHVSGLAAKTGTIQNANGDWVSTSYSRLAISTKTLIP